MLICRAPFLALAAFFTTLCGTSVCKADIPAVLDKELVAAFDLGLGAEAQVGVGCALEVRSFGVSATLGCSSAGGSNDLWLPCLLCSRQELITRARELGAAIAARRNKTPPSSLVLSLETANAVVDVDGLPFAPLAVPHLIEPGSHTVRIREPKRSAEIAVEVSPGGRAVAVPPWGRASSERGKAHLGRLRALTVICGVGLAAAASGAAVLALDGHCAATDQANGNRCTEKFEGVAPGTALTSAGSAVFVGALVFAIVTYLRGFPETDARSEVTP